MAGMCGYHVGQYIPSLAFESFALFGPLLVQGIVMVLTAVVVMVFVAGFAAIIERRRTKKPTSPDDAGSGEVSFNSLADAAPHDLDRQD